MNSVLFLFNILNIYKICLDDGFNIIDANSKKLNSLQSYTDSSSYNTLPFTSRSQEVYVEPLKYAELESVPPVLDSVPPVQDFKVIILLYICNHISRY